MTDYTEDELRLAHYIACRGRKAGTPRWWAAYDAALAAIRETTERAANAMENLYFFTPVEELLGMTKLEMSIRACHAGAKALRNGEHLKDQSYDY